MEPERPIFNVSSSKTSFDIQERQPGRSSLSSPSLHLGLHHAVVSRLRLLRELVHRRNRHHVPSHDVLADVPRQLLSVVLGMLPIANVEDGVELLKRERLGLRKQEVAVHSSKQIPAGVPAEGAGGSESSAQSGPAEGDDEVEAPAGGCREGHTDVADVKRESFGGVSERDRPFRGRVNGHETEDGGGDGAQLRIVRFSLGRRSSSNQETEAAPKQADGHEREAAEEQVAASKCIDSIDRWDSE